MALANQHYGQNIKFHKDGTKCHPFASPLPNSYSWRNAPPKGDLEYERGLMSMYLTAHDRVCDFQSGKEESLQKWILEQPDNSIDPYQLYKKSLEIHSGDIWASVVAIHQLLRNNARWRNSYQYKYDSSPEKQKAFFDKFIDIRGDLWELGKGYHGDHAGGWYRIWAAMLVRMNLSKGDLFSKQKVDPVSNCIQGDIGLARRIIGDLADEWAIILSKGDGLIHNMLGNSDKRKGQINGVGAEAAAAMLSAWVDPSLMKQNGITDETCRRQIYISK